MPRVKQSYALATPQNDHILTHPLCLGVLLLPLPLSTWLLVDGWWMRTDQDSLGSQAVQHEVPLDMYLWNDEPVMGEAVRLPAHTPQVVLRTNYVLGMCADVDRCKYHPSPISTPVANATAPLSGKQGTELAIALVPGTMPLEWLYDNLVPVATADGGTAMETSENSSLLIEVLVGGSPCNVTAADQQQVRCVLGPTPAGRHEIVLRTPVGDAFFVGRNANTTTTTVANGTGTVTTGSSDSDDDVVATAAQDNCTDRHAGIFTATIGIDSVYPTEGSLYGGTILTITGHGFANFGTDNLVRLLTTSDDPDRAPSDGIACIPRVLPNYHCAGTTEWEGWVDCDRLRAYGYSPPGERHFAQYIDFNNHTSIECVVANGTLDHLETFNVDVEVEVNGFLARAPDDSRFSFTWDATPVVDAVLPGPNISAGVPIRLVGSNLGQWQEVVDQQYYMDRWANYRKFRNVTVWFGAVDYTIIFGDMFCFMGDVTTEDGIGIEAYTGIAPSVSYDERALANARPVATSDTEIVCTPHDIVAYSYDHCGKFAVHVYVHGKGFAQVQTQVLVGPEIQSISPPRGSFGGGNLITLTGTPANSSL